MQVLKARIDANGRSTTEIIVRLSATEHIDQSRPIMARAPQPSEEPPDARWAVKV